MKRKLFFILFISSITLFAQTNIGFEDGTVNGWVCKSGFYGGPAGTYPCATPPPFVFTFNATVALDGKQDNPLDPATVPNKTEADFRHTIMTKAALKDPNSNNIVSPVAPGNLFPTGTNNYSFRLGNSVGANRFIGQTQAFAEAIKMTFLVDKTNAGLTYMYAAFLLDKSHPTNQAPRFEVKITQVVNGKDEQIPCGYYKISAIDAAGAFNNGPSDWTGATWRYTDWTKVALDLTTYIGKQISIEFSTADCYPNSDDPSLPIDKCKSTIGSHSAYAYIDLYTAPVEIASPTLCANAPSIQLCAPPGYATYQWPSGQPGIQPPLNKQCVTVLKPKAGDNYTVKMTSNAGVGCENSMNITLKGTDFNVRDTSVCTNTLPLEIKAVPAVPGGAYEWDWKPKQNLSCYDCANPIFTPGSTITYTVTMRDKNVANCDRIKNVTINVGASFIVKTTDATICEGETATITAKGAETYSWEPGSFSGDTYSVTPTTTTTYTVTGKSTTGACPGTATATAVVTVDKKPIVTVTDVTICAGETATLNGSVTGGGSSGAWIGGENPFLPNRSALDAKYKPSAAEIAAGKVTLTLESEDPFGPCGKASKTMTITISPGVKADAGPDVTICFGRAAQLNAPTSGGTWSGGTLASFSDVKDPKATYTPTPAEQAAGKITLKYTVVNSSPTCPGGSDEMVISIEKISVDAGADQTICFGETAKLTGSVGGVATKGMWSGGGVFLKDKTDLNATYAPSAAEMAAGAVKLFLTTNGTEVCPAAIDSMVISINPKAVVDAGPYQAICYPGSVPLAGVVSGGATSGSWSGGSGGYLPSPNSANAIYTPSASEVKAGKALLTFTTNDPLGPCPAVSDTMSIAIYKNAVADAGKTTSVCMGSPIQLNGTITGGNGTGTWSGGLGGTYVKSVNDLKASYTPTPADIAAGKVTFTLKTNATGLCPLDSATVTHFINLNPIINFAVDTPKACPPHCVDFTDSTLVLGANIVKWEWDFGNKATGTVKNPKDVCYNDPGFYTVSLKATSDKGCVSILEKPYMIETYPKPTAQFTAEPNPVSLYDPTVHFYDQSSNDVKTWVWNLGDGKIISPNVRNPIHQYLVGVSATYNVTLTVTNQYGCKDSIPHAVEVQPEFTFFIPNAFTPGNSEKVNDTFYGKGVGIVEYHLWVFDRWGNMVFTTKDINTGWDGHANNGADIAQQDVYVWKVKLKDVFGKNHEYVGTVTLVR